MTVKYTPFPSNLMPVLARVGQERLFEFARIYRKYGSKKSQRRYFIEQHRTFVAEAGACSMKDAQALLLAVFVIVNDVERHEGKTHSEPMAPGSTRLLVTRNAGITSMPEMYATAAHKATQLPQIVDERMLDTVDALPESLREYHNFRTSDIDEAQRILDTGTNQFFRTVFNEGSGRQDHGNALSAQGGKADRSLQLCEEDEATDAATLAIAQPILAKEFGVDILADNLWEDINKDPVAYWTNNPSTDPRAIQAAFQVALANETGRSRLMLPADRTVCGAQDMGGMNGCRKTLENCNVIRGPIRDGWGLINAIVVKAYAFSTRNGVKGPGTPMLYQAREETATMAVFGYEDSFLSYKELSESPEPLYLHGPNADPRVIQVLVEAATKTLKPREKLTNWHVWEYAKGWSLAVMSAMKDVFPGIDSAGTDSRKASKTLRLNNEAYNLFITSAAGLIVPIPLWEFVKEEDPNKPGKLNLEGVEVHVFLPGMLKPERVRTRVQPLQKTKSDLKLLAYMAQMLESDCGVHVVCNAPYAVIRNHDNAMCHARWILDLQRRITDGYIWVHKSVNPLAEICERAGIEMTRLGSPIDWENEVRGSIIVG